VPSALRTGSTLELGRSTALLRVLLSVQHCPQPHGADSGRQEARESPADHDDGFVVQPESAAELTAAMALAASLPLAATLAAAAAVRAGATAAAASNSAAAAWVEVSLGVGCGAATGLGLCAVVNLLLVHNTSAFQVRTSSQGRGEAC
jgi:hypothetical protein